jgi:hypothetical protein
VDHERLVAREKPSHDGAEPSGASVATLVALRLHAFTGEERYRRVAERALRAHAPVLEQQPAALHEMLVALDLFTDAAREVVLVWPRGERGPGPLGEVLRRTFLPSAALPGAAEGAALEALSRVAPVARDRAAVGGRATAYVCESGACRLPVQEAEPLAALLSEVKPLR